MKEITFKFSGKQYTVAANNSGWIAPGVDKNLAELLKAAPRSGVTSKGVPIVKDDDGHNLYLGAAELRQENEKIHQEGGSGVPSVSKQEAEKHAKLLLGMKGIPAETVAWLQGFIQEDPAIRKARQALSALGKTPEEINKILGL